MSQGTFAELGLPSEMVKVLERKLITEPFDIQAMAIPDALQGIDILGRAPTGSGKTLAFGLPMLARLDRGAKKRPRGLILSPTRELAEQIARELEPLAAAMDRSVLAVYGGTGLDRQIKALSKGVDVLVACPGRLLDLINQRAVDLGDVDIAVVDEADRMADMGFLPDVRKLLDQTSENRQTVLFSATLDKDVKILTDRYQDDPVIHEVGEAEPDLSTMAHRFIKVKKTDRVWLAADIIAEAGTAVVFCRTRHGVDRVARQLKQEGIKAGYIHGGRSQSQRDRALAVFTDGKVDALVATDVAARGIHVDGVACVIHYDPPADMKDYVHRSGRTARAGARGVVVSFLDPPQVKESQKMQRRLGLEAELEDLPERQPRSSRPATVDDRRAEPKSSGKGSGKGRKRSDGAKSSRPKSSSGSTKPKAKSTERSGGGSAGRRSSGERSSARERSSDGERGSDRERSSNRGSESRGSDARSGGGRSGSKPASRSGSRKASAGRPSGSKTGTGRSGTGRPGERKASGKPGSSKAGGSKSGGGAKRSGPSSSGRPTSGSKPGGKKRSAKAGAKGAESKPPKPKRSGKARPKNRKNKPKAGGRR